MTAAISYKLFQGAKMREAGIVVGAKVAFNTLPDAEWFDVVAIDGFTLTVREGPGYVKQYIDKSLVKQVKTPV